ncbi:MAG: alanine--tRNA ligase, partial [Planctomycetota bacterium]
MKSCQQIRKEFIEFFEERGHAFVPSSPLLPAEDPTLLFANAGMNQFKDIFLGREHRDYKRAVNTQKCIRAGGKHNDLEDVGHDTYHHTFFEMLGNWSFGDYFKREAIQWAWELLTDVWGLPRQRLYATVFEGDASDNLAPDTEAENIWSEVTDIDPSHICKGDKKDNFWEMGETGPCGPCSEIHIDLTDDLSGGKLVNASDPRVIEIWNLVFIQFNRDENGKLSPLPEKHVDTGMGLERIGMVLQQKRSDYASDLWVPIIKKIETLTDHRYGADSGLDDRFDASGEENISDVACRVIADHTRTLVFAVTDGVIPSNEGRGYVLRRILRRAVRYGRQYLNIEGPFVSKLVETVVNLMGGFFTELKDRRQYVIETILSEEESFGKTLDRGIELFQRRADELVQAGKSELAGDVAFDLYATYGFPVDLTQVMAAEANLTVDIDGYDAAMARHRELSSAEEAFKVAAISDLPTTDDSPKYSRDPIQSNVLGWVVNDKFVSEGGLSVGDEAGVILDRTNFYAEQGGQVGDAGHLIWDGGKFAVRNTVPAGASVLHVGVLEAGSLKVAQTELAEVDEARFDTMRNHTATHLLNWALREVLGEHVNQAGSVVAPDRLRFDFTHNKA